jgi:hypothetical protein
MILASQHEIDTTPPRLAKERRPDLARHPRDAGNAGEFAYPSVG